MFPAVGEWKTFDTTYLAKYFPIFMEKMGGHMPLEMHLRAKDVDVMFGKFDTDVIISYTLCIDFKEDKKKSKVFFYDELEMVTTGMIKT